MLGQIVAMVLFVAVGAVTPGPVNLVAVSAAARFGALRTLPYVLGAASGYTLVVALTGLGACALLQAVPVLATGLRYLGSFYLVYLALQIARSAPLLSHAGVHGSPPGPWQGALVQLLNPKAWLVALSGIGLFLTVPADDMRALVLLCLISWLVCFAGVGIWALLGQVLQYWLRRWPPGLFNHMMAALLLLLVVQLLLS